MTHLASSPELRTPDYIQPVDRTTIQTPADLMPSLFRDVQMAHIYPDSKTFADRTWLKDPGIIEQEYQDARMRPGFNLTAFLDDGRFGPVPPSHQAERFTGPGPEYVEFMWRPGGGLYADVTNYQPDHGPEGGSSLILDKKTMADFTLCGGRYGNRERPEFYGWDEWYKCLGLAAAGHWGMVRNHVLIKANMIRTYGVDTNGNRTYYIDREHPPVFALMVKLLEKHEGPEVLLEFLDALVAENNYWTAGEDNPDLQGRGANIVRLPKGTEAVYNSLRTDPRAEGYREDIETAKLAAMHGYSKTSWHKRIACATGHDFGPRTMADGENEYSTNAGDVIMFEHQGLVKHGEDTIARAYKLLASRADGLELRNRYMQEAERYTARAQERMRVANFYHWNEARGLYMDYNFVEGRQTDIESAANGFMLLTGMASQRQQDRIIDRLEIDYREGGFSCVGGLVTVINETIGEHNWGKQNSWSFLVYPAAAGAARHARRNPQAALLAHNLPTRWCGSQDAILKSLGMFVEKCHSFEFGRPGGGNKVEYKTVPGFGTVNGPYLAFHEGAHYPGRMRELSQEAIEMERIHPGLIARVGLQAARQHAARQ